MSQRYANLVARIAAGDFPASLVRSWAASEIGDDDARAVVVALADACERIRQNPAIVVKGPTKNKHQDVLLQKIAKLRDQVRTLQTNNDAEPSRKAFVELLEFVGMSEREFELARTCTVSQFRTRYFGR